MVLLGNPWLRLALAVLADYRLAQLVAQDEGPGFVFLRLREWVQARAEAEPDGRGPWHSLQAGLECPYCIGVWAALGLAALVLRPSELGDFLLVWLGVAGGQARLHRN